MFRFGDLDGEVLSESGKKRYLRLFFLLSKV